MLVIAQALVLSEDPGVNLTHPLIGWHNLVTAAGIASTTEETGYPASNLANVATNLLWRSDSNSPPSTEYITITTSSLDLVDYVGVANHNWGSAQIPVTIGYWDDDQSPVAWVDLVEERILPDDGPVLFRFDPQVRSQVVIRLGAALEVPEAAVVYAGKLLVMERGLHMSPHTPLDYGREQNVVSGMSESGNFLGRVVVGAHNESAAEFQFLTAAWYRSYFDPFLIAAKGIPFFFAWKPSTYPLEVGYAWLTASPKPAVDHATGRMNISLPMRGVT